MKLRLNTLLTFYLGYFKILFDETGEVHIRIKAR